MVAQRISKHIAHINRGIPFTAKSFLDYGSRSAVDQALSRLAKAGTIMRVTRGVYVRPEENRYIGKVLPEPAKVVQTIAKARGEIVEVHGAEAARYFGLTTQVPTQPIFYTTGPTRSFMMGNLKITMRHRSRSKLVLAGTRAGQAVSALSYLGKEQATPARVAAIRRQLPEEEYLKLERASSRLPGWMINSLRSAKTLPARA